MSTGKKNTRKGMSLDEFLEAGHVFTGGEETKGDFSHPEAFRDKSYLQDVKDINSLYTKLDGFANNQVGEFSHPDEYKDKPYLQDVKDIEALYAKFDGAETLLGKKRTVLPDDNSSDIEIADFNKARGVPDDSNSYEPIDTSDGADNTFFDAMRSAFKEANMTQAQVKTLVTNLTPVLEKITGEKLSGNKANDEEFNKIANGIFGATKDVDLANAKVLLNENAPEGMMQHVTNLGNKELIILASVLKGVRAKYINEDNSFVERKGRDNITAANELRKQGQEQIAIANNTEKTREERDAAARKANELYAEYDRLTKK